MLCLRLLGQRGTLSFVPFPSTRHDKLECGCTERGCLQGFLTKLSVSREDITLVLMPWLSHEFMESCPSRHEH